MSEAFDFLKPEGQTVNALITSIDALPEGMKGLHPRDKRFLNKVLNAARFDPEIIGVVIEMRMRLNQGGKLTRDELFELIEVLKCQGFYHTDLDLSGYRFKELNLQDAVIGGDADFTDVTIRGDLNQSRMLVKGTLNQQRMKIGGTNQQSDLRVEGHLIQDGMLVELDNIQSRARVKKNASQVGMAFERDNDQHNMWVGGNIHQEGFLVLKNNDQAEMEIEGNIYDEGMAVFGKDERGPEDYDPEAEVLTEKETPPYTEEEEIEVNIED